MSSTAPDFHDYGLHPYDAMAAPWREQVRCSFSPGSVTGQWLITLLVALLAAAFAMGLVVSLPEPIRWVVLVTTAFTGIVGIAWFMRRSFSSMELDGNRLLITNLYTGAITERSIDEVARLMAIVRSGSHPTAEVGNPLLGRLRGYDLHFRDGRAPLRITPAEPAMTGACEFIEGVLQRLSQRGPLDVGVVEIEDRPYVEIIRPIDSDSQPESGANPMLYLAAAMVAAFLFGPMFAFQGVREENKLRIGNIPPHDITIRELLNDGPGNNRHITVTAFQYDGYVVEEKNGYWKSATIALYPDDVPLAQQKEIRVVLDVKSVDNERALKALFDSGRITGICSATSTSHNTTIRRKLVEANGGRALALAWSIDEMKSPPSTRTVTLLYAVAHIVSVSAMLLALFVWFRR